MKNEQLLAALACNRDVPEGPPSAKQDCSDVVNISVFFDGTGNNKDEDEKDKKWSNVARLWRSAEFLFEKGKANYPIYISGVGTPYNGKAGDWLERAVVEVEDVALGGGTGAGGERRTELGQQNVNDTLRNVLIANARQLGGAVQAYAQTSEGQSFSELGKALAAHRLIKIINLSIFGFSRGAALARAFSNDFLAQCSKDKDGHLTYQGYRIRIHFMGLFDTVASFGVPAANVAPPWDERNLVVPERVERCVHLVAAHELRFAFPVDLIRQEGHLKAGWREEAFPGVHSDVGGGYLPVEQGIENNYARIPMREMMKEAVTSGVRMLGYADIEKASNQIFTERFAIQPKTQSDYTRYQAAVGAGGSIEEQVTAHMKALYSAYGTMHRKGIETPYERQVRGNVKQFGNLSMAKEVARYRAALQGRPLGALSPVRFMSDAYAQVVQPDAWRLAAWDSTASDDVLEFIKCHVHDSKVDFLMNFEPSSYLRPRGMAESSRSVLAQGLQWLDDTATDIAQATAHKAAEAADWVRTEAAEAVDSAMEAVEAAWNATKVRLGLDY